MTSATDSISPPRPSTSNTNGTPSTVANGNDNANVASEQAAKLLKMFAEGLAGYFKQQLQEGLEAEKNAAEAKAKEEAAAKLAKEEEQADAAQKKNENSENKKQRIKLEDMNTELCKIDSVFDEDGDRKFEAWSDARGKADDDEAPTDEYDKWVLVLRRVFNRNNKDIRKTKLDVKSPLLKKIIKEVCNEGAMETETASIRWPSDKIFRYREKLEEAAEREGELAVKHFAVLKNLIGTEFTSKIRDIAEMFPRGVTTFEIVREAFWPGDVIVTYSGKHLRAYRFEDASYKRDNCGNRFLQIVCQYVNYDGKEFGLQTTHFSIYDFPGVMYIRDLHVFPLKYSTETDKFTAPLLERGRHFESLNGQCFRNHAGVGRTIGWRAVKTSINSRVMVDTATYNRIKADEEISVNSNGIKKEIADNGGKLTDELLMLCTHEIPGFSFMDKDFYMLDVDNITSIVWNEDIFEKLVLPEEQKELVRVLVENHTSKSKAFDDFVAGKGKGLVSVLHGPPGVGKTMTAEAVAEHTKRPLYIVTSGELGSDPSSMDSELSRVLDLTKTWDAVLLLDEADVFLEQRTAQDLLRNSLVSIFLRQLEYYQGILFLTTNRVSTFDEAFHSRIHVSLHYHDLTPEARENVWRNFAATLEGNVELNDAEYKELSHTQLNGRQIKNMVRTAQALANDKGEKINMKHMRIVLGVMTSFDLAKAASDSARKETDIEKN